MKKLVSVIIPVYNVEKYLNKCLDSIINQTYKNLEIILINDGSDDNSLEICLNYQKKDKRIKVYNKKNEGASSARNYGLEKSKGFYILFIDSDDYIDLNAIELLVKNSFEDTLVGLRIKTNQSNLRIINKYKYNNIKIIKKSLSGKGLGAGGCCGYLFQKDIINNIRFNEELILAEDMLFLIEYIIKIKEVMYLKEKTFYYYVLNNNSITRSNKDVIKKIKNICFVFDEINSLINNKLKKRINISKIKMIEKEMRHLNKYSEIKKIVNSVETLRYNKLNFRYLYFCYLINNKKIDLILNYYDTRRKIKKIIRGYYE